MGKKLKPIVDFLLGKTMSKKLTVFIIATIALFTDKLTGLEWTSLAILYISTLLYLNYLGRNNGENEF